MSAAAVGSPTLVSNALNGRPVVEFGAWGSGNYMVWSSELADIRTVFWVLGSQNGGGWLLGDTNTNIGNNGFEFCRGNAGNGGGVASTPIWSSAYGSGYVFGGATYVNGQAVDGTTAGLSGGYQLVDLVTTGNAVANDLAADRPSIEPTRTGGQQLGELIVYNTVLTDAQRQAVEQYLNAKWFGGNTLPASSPVSVAAGATLDLGGLDQAIGSLSDFSGAGGAVTNSGGYALTLTLASDGSSATFSGTISDGAGTVALVKSGNFTQVLAGSNSYSGATTISGGTLQIGNGGSGEYLASPTISNSGALVFNHADTLTYAGAISGSGQVTEQGGGMLILSGNNTYTGVTTVNASTLQVGSGGSGEGLASSITMSNNATVAFNHADALSYGGTIGGNGQLIKLGTGNLDLVGSGTYSGPTTISAGTLELDGGGNNLPAATALTIASSGVLNMAGNPLTVGSLSGSAGAIVMNSLSSSYPSTLTVAPSSGSTTFAGNIIGNNALALSGSGALTLSGTNTYTGGTTVSGGTLDIAAPSALSGSGLVTIAAGGRLVLGSGAGIGALLAASSPASSARLPSARRHRPRQRSAVMRTHRETWRRSAALPHCRKAVGEAPSAALPRPCRSRGPSPCWRPGF